MSDLLTIVIPTRNRAEHLERCLRSVFESQTATPHVIVSDNSTSVHRAIDVMRQKYEFTYLRQSGELTNCEHLNACLQWPTSRWMMLLHDDDELFPDALTTIHARVLECDDDVAIVVGGLQHIDDEGRTQWEAIPRMAGTFRGEDALSRLGLAFDARSPNTVFDVIRGREIGGFPPVEDIAADYTFFCQLALQGVTFCRERFGRYRWGHDQGTDLTTPANVWGCVRRSARMAELLRHNCSEDLADLLVDNNTWAFFTWLAPRWIETHPAFVADLCLECLRLSPHPGPWQLHARDKYPPLFTRAEGADAAGDVLVRGG